MAASAPASPSRTKEHHHFWTLLRSIGLHILGTTEQYERPKPVVETSFLQALARTSIHIVPALTSITIIGLNFGHLYLGRNIPGTLIDNSITLAIFQVLAKLQELMIVASLATVVFHVIRHELTLGGGLPFGFLSSGFSFAQISWFWSPDFWGALRGRISPWAKIRVAALLSVCGIIAATAGPSAAVLLVPRQQDWDAGGSDFYLRGREEDIFPRNVTVAESDLPSVCFGADATNYAMCPSGGYQSLAMHFSWLPLIKNDKNLLPLPISIFGQFASQSVTIASTTANVPTIRLQGSIRGIACQTVAIGPYLSVAMYQSQLLADWSSISGNLPWQANKVSHASRSQYRYWFGLSQYARSKIPTVRTMCSVGQNLTKRATTVDFPVMPEYACPSGVQSVDISQLNDTIPTTSLRTTWVHLPAAVGQTSAGLLIETPWNSQDDSRIVVGCSLDARWHHGSVDGTQGNTAVSGPDTQWGTKSELATPFRPLLGDDWVPIHLDDSWLSLLSPKATARNVDGTTTNLTTLETLLSNSALTDNLTRLDNQISTWNTPVIGSSNRTIYLEWVTSLFIADGLSRWRTDKALNMTGPTSNWELLDYGKRDGFDDRLLDRKPSLRPPNNTAFVTFPARITINGLAYKAQSTTDYLAIAVLLTHMLLALIHTMWILSHRKSSSAWDSIGEMLALAYNSIPSSALGNTSAGIRCLKTFGIVAAVRASPVSTHEPDTDEDPPPSRLDLVFEGHGSSHDFDYPVVGGAVTKAAAPATIWPLASSPEISTGTYEMRPYLGSQDSSQLLLPRRRRSRQRSQHSPSPGPGSRTRDRSVHRVADARCIRTFMDDMQYQSNCLCDDVDVNTAASGMSDALLINSNAFDRFYNTNMFGSLVDSSLDGVSGMSQASYSDPTLGGSCQAPRLFNPVDVLNAFTTTTHDGGHNRISRPVADNHNIPTNDLCNDIQSALRGSLYLGQRPRFLIVPLQSGYLTNLNTEPPPLQCKCAQSSTPTIVLASPSAASRDPLVVNDNMGPLTEHPYLENTVAGGSSSDLSVDLAAPMDLGLDLELLLCDSPASSLGSTLSSTSICDVDSTALTALEEHLLGTVEQSQVIGSHQNSDTLPARPKRRFPCLYKPCTRAFGSRKDLERHLATRRHRKDAASLDETLSRFNRYVCIVPWCKRRKEGFGRRDHFLRHMEKMHPGVRVEGDR
ncbi:hypothetical protein BDV96DRAFT_634875 [Lophiotrema nucula]|uniref:C2H2-type domain-containing protein n=1 Tax=Lophiotrema nucula TaxID=690887 RepID=A0A6A5YWX7_9PLEO|nr:hypothetical protein BDV96DRAFT_634875 [Lophiotrema nucula]